MPKRIMFTGGTGKAGRHVLPRLLGQGYEILNFDLQPFAEPDIFSLIGDVTDSGQVFNAMTMHFGRKGLAAGKPPDPVDAVVHFAAIPRVFIKADNETYRVNVMGTYNVIEAAMKLGIRKVVIASSETTYGVCFAEGDKDFHSFPLEEDYDVDPMDSYGLSKVVNENTARAFRRMPTAGTEFYFVRSLNWLRDRGLLREAWKYRSAGRRGHSRSIRPTLSRTSALKYFASALTCTVARLPYRTRSEDLACRDVSAHPTGSSHAKSVANRRG